MTDLQNSTTPPLAYSECYNQPFFNWNGIIDYSKDYHQTQRAEFGIKNLVTNELIELCKNKKYIVIYGHTKSGKVLFGKLLSEALGIKLIISDDYKYLGWKQNMYHIRKLIKSTDESLIIEGVQSGRLLRKGVEFNDFFADLVIHLEINKQSLSVAYQKDGEGYKLRHNKVFNFNKHILDNIFFKWYEMQKKIYPEKMPIIINADTSFCGF